MIGVPFGYDAIMMMIDCAALVTRFRAARPGNFGNTAEAHRVSD
ncbi:hypothetical protein [Bradyrhizobium sp. CCBAU 53415]|nr:hypothetical protein [Bradyrhizobium sp. CCBAU 53415]